MPDGILINQNQNRSSVTERSRQSFVKNIERARTWLADDVIGGDRITGVAVGNGRQRGDNGM